MTTFIIKSCRVAGDRYGSPILLFCTPAMRYQATMSSRHDLAQRTCTCNNWESLVASDNTNPTANK